MIETSSIARPLLAVAAALLAAPLAAQEPLTVRGEPLLQESVSFADLDLRQSPARQTLKARVYRAAYRLCAQADGPSHAIHRFGLSSSPTCASLTYRDARPQIAAAVQRAEAGQQLTAAAVVVSAPRVR